MWGSSTTPQRPATWQVLKARCIARIFASLTGSLAQPSAETAGVACQRLCQDRRQQKDARKLDKSPMQRGWRLTHPGVAHFRREHRKLAPQLRIALDEIEEVPEG